MISEKILKILNERREITLRELCDELEEHPGVVKKVLESLKSEKKINIKKKYYPHKPLKYETIIEAGL